MSCKNNRNGELPSCIEAKFDGPGCEDWDLCSGCADTLKKQLDETNRLNGELRDALHLAYDWMGRKAADAYQDAHLRQYQEKVKTVLQGKTERPNGECERCCKHPGEHLPCCLHSTADLKRIDQQQKKELPPHGDNAETCRRCNHPESNVCWKCGWDMDNELAQGFASASRSLHPDGTRKLCSKCASR